MRRPVLLLLVPVVALAASCGLRSGVESGAGSRSATTTAAGLTPPTSAPAKTASTFPPSTKAAGANAGVTTSKPALPPTTKPAAATTKVPTPAPTTTKAVDKKAALCAAAKIYAVDDLPGLGQRILADPDGILKAYEDMVANATPELAESIKALGPFTNVVLGAVKSGDIKTSEQLTNYLANAPTKDLEGWVLAQQTVAPALQALCGTAPPTTAAPPA